MHADLTTRKRLLLLLTVLTLLFFGVVVRIGSLSLFQGATLTARGVAQWTRKGVISARRGDILASGGETLVMSGTAYAISVNPQRVDDDKRFADVVAPLLGMDAQQVLSRVSRKGYASVLLKRQATRETADELRALRTSSAEMRALLRGITFDEDTRRWYPKGAFCTQALGLTNIDAKGQSGLEQTLDETLSGTNGSLLAQVDAKANVLPDGVTAYVAPVQGSTVRLTIDATIQSFAERAMRECIAVNNAKSVQCIVMDVNTGAILALCMKPDFDPNDPPREDVSQLTELMRISAISDAYEPGSVFKVLTAAAALDCGATTPEDTFTCHGSITIDGSRVRCWKNAHGTQTMAQSLQNSCNPVYVTLALRMGKDTMYQYLRAFGLGVKTGVDLPGEGSGILINSRYVKEVDLARIGFGQSVAVTPLQMITAVSAAVNGGRLMKPYIVREVVSPDGETLGSTQAQVVSAPIRYETSLTMRKLLEDVVALGGGKNAAVSGYRVGGKTGTAQVYKNGRIVSDVHIGSFVGFAPADNPRFAVLVVVNEARVPVDYGGTTAAPFAREIIADTLAYMGYHPETPGVTKQPERAVPDVRGMTLKDAARTLGTEGFLYETDGVSDTVSAQSPASGAALAYGGRVMLYTYEQQPPDVSDLVCVPDVYGMSMVAAGQTMRARGLEMRVSGSGLANAQSPAAGTYVPYGSVAEVTFTLP